VKGRLQVHLDDVPIEDPSLIVIRVTNGGNVSIRPKDFERPLSFAFGPTSEVLSAEITRRRPHNMTAALVFDGGRVTLAPLLLNGGDSVDIKCLVSRVTIIDDDARIEGVSYVRRTYSESIAPLIAGFSGIAILVGSFFLLPDLDKTAKPRGSMSPTELFINGVGILGMVLMSVPTFLLLRRLLPQIRVGWGRSEKEH